MLQHLHGEGLKGRYEEEEAFTNAEVRAREEGGE